MDTTLGLALVVVLLALLLIAVGAVMGAMITVLVWRNAQQPAIVRVSDTPRPAPVATLPPTRTSTMQPLADTLSGQPGGGLLGFFDDESSVGGMEGAHTEVFQRSNALSGDWSDSADDEDGATEIFSAHAHASELSEFAFDESDESTGRFSKTGHPIR